MLAAEAGPDSVSRSASSGHVHIGWTGRGNPQILARNGFIVALDGTLFNRAELGHDDLSAVEILHSQIARHGFAGALSRLNGDFAIAAFDFAAGKLWLARDRFGIKPIYYARAGGGFAFASRMGALLRLPAVSRKANRQFAALFAASHYRTFDNDPSTSPFADIAQLPAGHWLELQPGRDPRIARYWDLEGGPEHRGSLEELAARYRDLLIDAVRLRFEAAQKPAFTLSGGMDSSSVLACAVRTSGSRQHAFSSVYEDKTFDESDEIRSMLEYAVEHWHPLKIATPDVQVLVSRMVRAHDEPVATATWLSHFLICKEASRLGFRSLFGGLGGDELNAGEYEYFFFHFADLRRTGREEDLRREVGFWTKYHDHPIHRKNFDVVEQAFQRTVRFDRPGVCLPNRSRQERYLSALNPEFFDLKTFAPSMDAIFESYLKNRTYQDIFRETAPCCLRAEDRQTAAHGLDHFDPFFDHRLVEFMFRVPGDMKIKNGVTKVLLREATRGILPEETRTRIKKTGWNAPAHVWFLGRTLDDLRDTIHSSAFRQRGIYVLPEVEKILAEHERIVAKNEVRENHMMFLWQLLNLDVWARELKVDF